MKATLGVLREVKKNVRNITPVNIYSLFVLVFIEFFYLRVLTRIMLVMRINFALPTFSKLKTSTEYVLMYVGRGTWQ